MATKKYNQGGGLNWFWVQEDMQKHQTKQLQTQVDNINDFIDTVTVNSIPKSNNTTSNVTKTNKIVNNNYIVMCNSTQEQLEAKFNFIKMHSDSKEDLEIAKYIVSVS